ncbi:hypothetical protein WJX73_001941 [Symbiochloris irregularis]|uniref:Uncharacterized protein n=1 Tax=Symbiochloris irregularis TaxID=706552 RepID=A0AAW1P082_9CHLO
MADVHQPADHRQAWRQARQHIFEHEQILSELRLQLQTADQQLQAVLSGAKDIKQANTAGLKSERQVLDQRLKCMHQQHEGYLNQRGLLHQGLQHSRQMLQTHRDASATFKSEHEDYLKDVSELYLEQLRPAEALTEHRHHVLGIAALEYTDQPGDCWCDSSCCSGQT